MPRDTKAILLIHGLWLAPACWDCFRQRYEEQGFRVLAPAWPHLTGTVAEMQRAPQVLAGLGLLEIAQHYEAIIRAIDKPPILMGHGLGGLIVQQLLDRGLGSAGIAIGATAPRDVWRVPCSMIPIVGRVLANPFNYSRSTMLTFPQFRAALANTMSDSAAREAYERYAIAGPCRPLFQAAFANWNAWAVTRVQRDHDERAPLLLVAGAEDRLSPAILSRINYKQYASSSAITDYKEFPQRSHLMLAEAGWEEVADYALTWADAHIEHAQSWLVHGVA